MDNISDTIKKILKGEPFLIADIISPASVIKNFEGFDSLQYLTFLLEIEKAFNIEITPEEIRKVVTIGDLENIIKLKIK